MSRIEAALSLLACLLVAAVSIGQTRDVVKPKQAIAIVDGQPIYDEDLANSVQSQLVPLRNQEYEIKRKALDNLIEQKLLEAAAARNGVTTEKLLVQEIDSKVADPSDAELEGFYLALKDRINRAFDDVKAQLRDALKQAKLQQARQDYLKRLRASSDVAVLLAPPRITVAYDPARVRGNPQAPVMIVEFSDYECPYCHQAESTIKQVLAKYGDKVSLAYRDFPLRNIHTQAEIAAEASRCAGEQGKFWEYHDQLFTASKLDKDALIEYARILKLNDQQFGACITSNKYKADIDKDVEQGREAGVSGTPAFFINGIATSGAQPQEAFARIIDDELARRR